MTLELAVDFAEQLLIFEDFGNVYAQHSFIQATKVSAALIRCSVLTESN